MKAHYENKLIAEKNNLLEQLRGIAKYDEDTGEWQAQSSDVNGHDADSNDNADRFEDFEEKSSLIIPLEKRLHDVENALLRITAGTYGRCVVCNNEIEPERLDANLSAETCLKHME